SCFFTTYSVPVVQRREQWFPKAPRSLFVCSENAIREATPRLICRAYEGATPQLQRKSTERSPESWLTSPSYVWRKANEHYLRSDCFRLLKTECHDLRKPNESERVVARPTKKSRVAVA